MRFAFQGKSAPLVEAPGVLIRNDHQGQAASAGFVRGPLDEGGANALPPPIRLDKQAVEFKVIDLLHDCGETQCQAVLLCDIHLAPLNLFGGEMDRVGMRFEVRAVIFIGE